MKNLKLTLGIALAFAGATAQAAGPLYTTDGPDVHPFRWDTTNGPIPAYTDGGEAFTFDFDGVTPFITIERANEVTAFALQEWSNVPTSTFSAQVAGTIEEKTGIADVTGANAGEIYGQELGYGIWVNYDTDGSILEDFFGVPKFAVLGIAFPEFADEDGNIIEAKAVMNGYYVYSTDTELNHQAGVFTHEFGHAINLSHSQVNGHLAYSSYPLSWGGPEFGPGVPGCDGFEPVHRYNLNPAWDPTLNPADPVIIETMHPFIDTRGQASIEQSTIDHADDMAAISDIYPTADYHATRGSISGVLRLKDGSTEYAGINVIARNVDNPLLDAVSGMSGMLTQGKVGLDGRFVINNLTPGASYVLYIEEIVSGGYPTQPTIMISQPEYWNDNEDNDPAVDNACDATPILAEAGVTKQADITFNGYTKGVQLTPVVGAYLVDMAKNGRSSSGVASNTAFIWDEDKGFIVLPPEFKANHGALNDNGRRMLVQYDSDGNGIQEPVLWSPDGSVIELGDLNGDTCGGASQNGSNSASGFDVDRTGNTVVGLAYVDKDGDGGCQTSWKHEIVPFLWTADGGMRELSLGDFDPGYQWVRAQRVSGNGEVVMGSVGSWQTVAWVNEGPMQDLYAEFGAEDVYAMNYDGTRTFIKSNQGVVEWNAYTGEHEVIGEWKFCVDRPLYDWFGSNLCDFLTPEEIAQYYGTIPMLPLDASDDGSVFLSRMGSFQTGFLEAWIHIDDIGWMSLKDFFHKQGVVEAAHWDFNNPVALDGSGSRWVGGTVGIPMAWKVDADQVYVCEKGKDRLVGFPNGLRAKIKKGAEFGRCAFIND